MIVLKFGGTSVANSENISKAIDIASPFGVDVSSGVEDTGFPGIKNHDKIIFFIEKAKKHWQFVSSTIEE